MQHHQMSAEATNSLAPHRVSLIRHSAASNLCALEWLFHFLQVGEQPQVRTDFVGCSTQGGKRGENIYVDLAGVGL